MVTARQCPVGMVEAAEKLAAGIVGQQLPEDWEPDAGRPWVGDIPWPLVLAGVRHEYTNYEALLWELPLCPYTESDWPGCDPECPYLGYADDLPCECPHAQQAHDILKWAGNAVAEDAIRKHSKSP